MIASETIHHKDDRNYKKNNIKYGIFFIGAAIVSSDWRFPPILLSATEYYKKCKRKRADYTNYLKIYYNNEKQ